MKADESADCTGSFGGRLPTGLCFFFFWGLEIVKIFFFLNSDFGWVQV
jgi:hypothetical protein